MSQKLSPVVAAPTSQPFIAIEPAALPVKEAAAFLGTTVRFVRTAIYGRDLIAIRLGKRNVISVSDLRAFLEKQRRAAA